MLDILLKSTIMQVSDNSTTMLMKMDQFFRKNHEANNLFSKTQHTKTVLTTILQQHLKMKLKTRLSELPHDVNTLNPSSLTESLISHPLHEKWTVLRPSCKTFL